MRYMRIKACQLLMLILQGSDGDVGHPPVSPRGLAGMELAESFICLDKQHVITLDRQVSEIAAIQSSAPPRLSTRMKLAGRAVYIDKQPLMVFEPQVSYPIGSHLLT